MAMRFLAFCFFTAFLLNTGWAAPFVPVRDAQCVAFSPDAKMVATGISGMSNEQFPPRPHPSPRKCGVVQLYEVNSGKRLRRFETYGDITRVRFSPDGRWLVFSRLYRTHDGIDLNAVGLLDLIDWKTVHYFDRCHGFDFSPDGSRIVILSRQHCFVFETQTRVKLHEIEPFSGAFCVRFSPDGQTLSAILHDEESSRIEICNAESGEVLATSRRFQDPFYNLTYSPDGATVASGHSGGNVLVWDATSLQPLTQFRALSKAIPQPFFSPDGEILGAGDQKNGDVVFWDISTGKQLRHYTFKQGTFRTYLRRSPEARLRPEVDPERFVFSPDGTAFLAGCYGGMIRTITDGRDLRSFGE